MVSSINKIFVCLYKEDQTHIVSDLYQPIVAGESVIFNPEFIGDGTGESIHKLNEEFGELTALYWIWKNQKCLDIIGHCHYRRYFWPHTNQFLIPESYSKDKFEISKNNFEFDMAELLGENDIVLPPISYLKTTVADQFKKYHHEHNLDLMRSVLSNFDAESLSNWDKLLLGNRVYLKLIFFMRREVFESYCNWIFPILFQFNQRKIQSGDLYQRRAEAFLAERLTLLFVLKNNLKVREVPYVFVSSKTKYVPYFWHGIKNQFNQYIFQVRNVL